VGRVQNGVITLDVNAAGHGWFIDPTPDSSGEFTPVKSGELIANRNGPAHGHMDLLSVVAHEVGHYFGFAHNDDGTTGITVMDETLATGMRHLPSAPVHHEATEIIGPVQRQTGLGSTQEIINKFGHQFPGLDTPRTNRQPQFLADQPVFRKLDILAEQVLPASDMRDSAVGRSVARLLTALHKTSIEINAGDQ
jgi:hypothetical protein